MPKFLMLEVYETQAESSDEAERMAKREHGRKKVFIMSAPSLDQLQNPAHVQEALDLFGAKAK